MTDHDTPIQCPCCARPMRLASVTARAGLPDVLTFDCDCCRVGLTRADDQMLTTRTPMNTPRAVFCRSGQAGWLTEPRSEPRDYVNGYRSIYRYHRSRTTEAAAR
jgi:hypothetical protein